MRISPPIVTLALILPCCAAAQTGPGGVGNSSNNVLWLSADQGTASLLGLLSSWADHSGRGNNAATPLLMLTSNPALVNNALNGLPVLRFDGTDDMMEIQDDNSLDLTAWHFFVVLKAAAQKNYNAWITKGNDGQENFEILSYSDANIHVPIYWTDGTRTALSAPAGQMTTGVFKIVEYSYRSDLGQAVYVSGSSVYTNTENKTPQVNNLSVYLGNERGTSGRFMDGDLAEIIAYNGVLNAAQRVIVNNYLSSKYNLTLASGDLYVQDNAANGNYDEEVTGIGRTNTSNQQLDSQAGIVRIKSTSGIPTANRFLFWGHNGGSLLTTGNTDYPPTMYGRWNRVWRVSEVTSTGGAGDVGNVDITFDLSNSGPVTASSLGLLIDSNNNGVFADEIPLGTAVADGGGKYTFPNVADIANNRRFTLGTLNPNTPLPIQLLSFSVTPDGPDGAQVRWSTASEQNNDHFTVERSADAANWNAVAYMEGAGNSSSVIDYAWADVHPLTGVSYYRLKQTDTDGTSTLSDIVSLDRTSVPAILVVPNPAHGRFHVPIDPRDIASARLMDAMGRVMAVPSVMSGDALEMDVSHLSPGAYLLRIGDGDKQRSVQVIVE